MSGFWQNAYNVFIAGCTIVSVTFMWRKDRREAKAVDNRLIRQAQQLRTRISTQMIALLYMHMIPIRRMYLNLSEEERLAKELQLTFDKPEVLDAIAGYHLDALEFATQYRRLSHLRLARRLCVTVSSLCFLGFIVPWLLTLLNEQITLSPFSWTLLMVAILPTMVTMVISISIFISERRLAALLQYVPEVP